MFAGGTGAIGKLVRSRSGDGMCLCGTGEAELLESEWSDAPDEPPHSGEEAAPQCAPLKQPSKQDGAQEPAPQYASPAGSRGPRPRDPDNLERRPSLMRQIDFLTGAEKKAAAERLVRSRSLSRESLSRESSSGTSRRRTIAEKAADLRRRCSTNFATTNFRGKTMDEVLDEARHLEGGERRDESQASFPRWEAVTKGWFPVLNPTSTKRLVWDFCMLQLILIITIVTPFELTFLYSPRTWPAGFSGRRTASGIVALFYANRVSDMCFLADMYLAFQTSYFDARRGEWELRRRAVARNYVRTWFLMDLLSLLPYSLLTSLPFVTKEAGFLRTVRLVRLLKLFRLLKQPRIMAKLKKYITVPIKIQTLLRYFVLFFVIIHWTACTLRLITTIALGDCHPADDDNRCPRMYLSSARRWEGGIWTQYSGAVLWSLGAMSGETYTEGNMEETILNILVLLLGIVVGSFLIGELANILGNFDPVGNAFSTTVDGLNSFLVENQFPTVLRLKLREYVILSETIYRERYYMSLIDSMSPTLKEAVASHRLASTVRRLSFFAYAMRRGIGIARGVTLDVAQIEGPPQRARIVAIAKGDLYYDVEYLGHAGETIDRERRVPRDRLDITSIGAGRQQLETVRILHIRTRFITAFALKLEPQLYMPYESIVEPNWSRVDSLYVVHSGRVAQFARTRASMWNIEVVTVGGAIGEDIATLTVGAAKRRTRHYLAKACGACVHVRALAADDFLEIVSEPNRAPLLRHIRIFGAWQIVRMLVYGAGVAARKRGVTLKQFFEAFPAVTGETPPPAPPSPPPPRRDRAWVARKLRDLDDLRDAGVIHLDEHATSRRRVLAKFVDADDGGEDDAPEEAPYASYWPPASPSPRP